MKNEGNFWEKMASFFEGVGKENGIRKDVEIFVFGIVLYARRRSISGRWWELLEKQFANRQKEARREPF